MADQVLYFVLLSGSPSSVLTIINGNILHTQTFTLAFTFGLIGVLYTYMLCKYICLPIWTFQTTGPSCSYFIQSWLARSARDLSFVRTELGGLGGSHCGQLAGLAGYNTQTLSVWLNKWINYHKTQHNEWTYYFFNNSPSKGHRWTQLHINN